MSKSYTVCIYSDIDQGAPLNLLRLYMTDIENSIGELCALVRQHAIAKQAIMFSLPAISKKDEALLIADDYDSIPVTPLVGQVAVEHAIKALKDMYVTDNDMSRRFVQKYPGLIPLSCSWNSLAPVIDRVNLAKQNFRGEVLKYENAEEKFFAVHDRFNYLITTMAYRGINAFEGDHKGFYFNWSRRARGETKTAQEWIERLDSARFTLLSSHTKSSWNALIDQEQEQIRNCGTEKLSMRRPNKLRPECSVRDADGNMRGHSASMPFFIAGHTCKPNFTELKDYSRKASSSTSSKWKLVASRPKLFMAV